MSMLNSRGSRLAVAGLAAAAIATTSYTVSAQADRGASPTLNRAAVGKVDAHGGAMRERGDQTETIRRAIEGGKAGFAFASGMSAVSAIVSRLSSGDHVIVTDNTYGGTFRLFDKVLTRYGLTFTYVDTSKIEDVEKAFTPATKLVFVETPTNPVLRLADIAFDSKTLRVIAEAGGAVNVEVKKLPAL